MSVSDLEKRFHVIILAGGEKGPLFETTGFVEKALIPIHGIPMLSRVVRVFRESKQVDEIVVVGSQKLDELPEMNHVRKRIFTGLNVVQNLLHAITYVKHRLYESRSQHNGYVISFCDAVFLDSAMIDDTLAEITRQDADVVLHYVEKASFEAENLPAKRTYLPVAGMQLTGSTIYYLKSWTKVMKAMPTLIQLRKHRKNPEKVFELIGCQPGMSLDEIASCLSQRLGINVKICVSPHARLGMDVDKPSDLELAEELLS